jgi:CYTH domain-containing protein/CHAD domain-containing protein
MGTMAFVLAPAHAMQTDVRRVARERLGDAVERLAAIRRDEQGELDLETEIHEVRKRCKESRGLARLVRRPLGDDFRPFDRSVRDAARELAGLRDAHATVGTLDVLLASHGREPELVAVRDHLAAHSAAAAIGRERIDHAAELLGWALADSQGWTIPAGFAPLGYGLAGTYDRGRRWLRRARRRPTDNRLHEWRKSVKYLWYQTRLLRDAAPSVLVPLVGALDDLSDALGDDHDLAVLVSGLERLEGFDDVDAVERLMELARAEQTELRRRAMRTGATIYAETTAAFEARVGRYWRLAVERGPEMHTGGIATIHPAPATDAASAVPVERERRFLVEEIPSDLALDAGVAIEQGYLAVDAAMSVRVRTADGRGSVTIKAATEAGSGSAERIELEWPVAGAVVESLWPHTAGRRIEKTRHRLRVADAPVELDRFGGLLDGLVVAEVEFESADTLATFEPPGWFGAEVTDDARYSNAALAVSGLPADHPPPRSGTH